jgi:purine-binding chemotaxis protein CheW
MPEKDNKLKENRTSPINWEGIRSSLESFREKLEADILVSEKDKEQILRTRAKALSREIKKESLIQDYLEVVEFVLANEKYGIELNSIVEVYTLKDLTSLPGTPPFILGVISVRGKILTIIDIKKLFELQDKGISDLNKVIIVHAHGMEAGILADVITGVRSIPVDKIQPTLPTLTDIRADYMKGVTGDQLIILDVENIFSDERIIVNEVI